MTADSTVAEIEASGGAAMGIELDVRDPEDVPSPSLIMRTKGQQNVKANGA